MLAPNPEQRYATPADVAEALKPFAAKSNLKQLALAAAADAPSRTITPPKRFGGRLGRFVIAAAALLGMALAGFAIYVETDKGQIVIHSNVDDVQVLVKRTGKLYDALDELEVDKGDNQWKFRSGSYEVQLLGKTDGLRVKDGVFTLTRDGKAVVTIERDPARAKTVAVSGPVYEGKTLEEWIELLLMEKSVPQRSKAIPGITVLGIDAPDKAIAALFKVGVENDSSTSHYNNKSYLQKEIIQAIQKLSPDQIPSTLLDALQDSDVKKRRYAAQFIRHHWDNDPPITLVRTAAKDPDENVRRDAVGWLAQYGSVAIPDLIVALDDESDKVRRAAVSAVSLMASYYKTLTPEDARILEPKIYDMVDDKSAKVRESRLWALRSVASDDQKLLAVLEAALHDPVPEVQVASIDVLRTLGPKAAAAVPALTDALKSRNRKKVAPIITSGGSELSFTEPIPAGLIRALGSIGPDAKSGVPVIKEFLQHEHKDVRKAVVEAIQQITGEDIELPEDDKTPGNKTAKGPVYGDKTLDEWIAFLKTQRSAAMRRTAIMPIETLGVDEPEKAIAALIDAGSDYDPRNMEEFENRDEPKATWIAIIKAIERLSPSQIPTAVLQALGDKDVKKRRFATGLMDLYQDDVPPIEAAKKAAEDSDEFVRFQTMAWVGRYGHDSVPILIAAFADQSENVRRRALEAVAHLGINGDISPDDAKLLVPRLYEMLQDKDSWVKAAALAALLRVAIDQDKLLTVLAEAVGDTDPQVMSAAIECLEVLGPKAAQAVPVLVESLKRCGRTTLKPDDILASGPEPGVVLDNAPLRLIVALGAIGPSAKTAVSTIKEFLKHDNAHIRNAAVRAIKQITGEDIELPQDNKTAAAGPVYDGKTFDEWVTLLKTDKSPQRQIEGIKALVALGTAENASRALEIVFEMGASHSIPQQTAEDQQVIEEALLAISRIKNQVMVQELVAEKLNDNNEGARLFALNVLTNLLKGGQKLDLNERTRKRLVEMADDPSVQVREELAVWLVELVGKSAVPALIQMSENDKNNEVRRRAFRMLALVGEIASDALPLFLEGVLSSDERTRDSAYEGIGNLKPDAKQLNEALLKALGSDDESVRRDVMGFLNARLRFPQESPELLPVVIAAIETGPFENKGRNRSRTRLNHIRLEEFDKFPKEVTIAIVRKLESAEELDRERWHSSMVSFSNGLGGFPASALIVDELVHLYQDADVSRRVAILQLLGALRANVKPATALYETALKDKDPQVRAAAEAALKGLKSQWDVLTASQNRSSFENQSAVSLTIKVSADGKLSIGDKPYDLQALKTLLAEQVKQAGERGVAVRIEADRRVKYATTVSVLETVNTAGVQKFYLAVENTDSPQDDETKQPPPPQTKEGAAVYDGKTFDEWLSILKTETNPAKLAPVITAVGATGARGREREATAAILNLAKLMIAPFNESLYSNEDEKKLGELYNAINIALTRIGAPHATDALIEAVIDPHLGMRRHAQQVLYEWTMSEEYADQIFAALKHKDPKLREWAVAQLAKIADSGVRKFDVIVAQLFEIISNDKSLAMRRAAAQELRRLIGNPNTGDRRAQIDRFKARRIKEADGALEQLYSLAKDQDPTVRFCVLWVLTRIEADPATLIPLLADAAGDKKSATQQLVIDELSNLAPRLPAAIAALIASYPHFGADERIRVVNALGHKGTIAAPAIPLLKEAVKSDDQLLRQAAREALKKVEPAKQ